MINILKINVKKDIAVFKDKFKDRDSMKYQKKIDNIVDKIDIAIDHQFWKNYIESSQIIVFSDYCGDDITGNIEQMKFQNEEKAYFIYKIILELLDEDLQVYMNISVIANNIFLKKKQYFDDLISLYKFDQTSRAKELSKLNFLLEEIDSKYFTMNRNVKNKTENLLGSIKRNSFRPNKEGVPMSFKITCIEENQKYNISCPLCAKKQELTSKQKSFIKEAKNRIRFMCDHEKTHFIGNKEVIIELDKDILHNIKNKKIDVIDFVIYNYKYFFNQWKVKNNAE